MGKHKDSKSDKESEFQKMVRQLGLSKSEIADMLGLTKRNPKTGMQEHKKGGMVKKKAIGATDYRMNKGGLLLSSVDNRKKR